MKTEIQERLEQLAFNRTTPFCYGCYVKAPKGVCPHCNSDDLMRHLEGVGVEWGTDWVIKHILQEELTAIYPDEAFEDSYNVPHFVCTTGCDNLKEIIHVSRSHRNASTMDSEKEGRSRS